jgi:hypothetical protein
MEIYLHNMSLLARRARNLLAYYFDFDHSMAAAGVPSFQDMWWRYAPYNIPYQLPNQKFLF